MSCLEETTIGELNAGDLSPFKVCLFKSRASAEIRCGGTASDRGCSKVHAVTAVNGFEERVVAEQKLGEMDVLITGTRVSDLDVLQFDGTGEVRLTNLIPRKVTDRSDLGRTVNLSLSVVDIVERTDKSMCLITRRPLLKDVRPPLDRSINVCIRSDRKVRNGITTEEDEITLRIASVVLGVEVSETVI